VTRKLISNNKISIKFTNFLKTKEREEKKKKRGDGGKGVKKGRRGEREREREGERRIRWEIYFSSILDR